MAGSPVLYALHAKRADLAAIDRSLAVFAPSIDPQKFANKVRSALMRIRPIVSHEKSGGSAVWRIADENTPVR
jgi:hypothetical protein